MNKSVLTAFATLVAFSSVSIQAANYVYEGWQPTSQVLSAEDTKLFESHKKQPPPPVKKRQLPGTINPGIIIPGTIDPDTILDIGGKATCTGSTPGCRPPETGGGGNPNPPDCGDVGPNEPCG